MDRCTSALADLAATCNARMSTDPGQPATTPAEYLRWLKQVRAPVLPVRAAARIIGKTQLRFLHRFWFRAFGVDDTAPAPAA